MSSIRQLITKIVLSRAVYEMVCTPSSLASLKSRMVYLSGAGLPRLSWNKGR